MTIQTTIDNGIVSIEISGWETPERITRHLAGQTGHAACSACVINIRQLQSDHVDVNTIYSTFRTVEQSFDGYLKRSCKPLAFVEPGPSEAAGRAFQLFFALMSNYLEWSVREEAKRIRRFQHLDDALVWIRAFPNADLRPAKNMID